MTTLNAKAEAAKNVFAVAAQAMTSVKTVNAEKIETATDDDAKAEFVRAYKHADTHERFNNALSSMSDKAMNCISKYAVDAEKLAEQSRELKKRSIAILEALANNKRVDDRALDAVLQRLAAKHDASLNLVQIQREMQHETTTQAQYFKKCAEFFNFAQYSKSDKTMSFNYESKVLKDLLKLYTVAEA